MHRGLASRTGLLVQIQSGTFGSGNCKAEENKEIPTRNQSQRIIALATVRTQYKKLTAGTGPESQTKAKPRSVVVADAYTVSSRCLGFT